MCLRIKEAEKLMKLHILYCQELHRLKQKQNIEEEKNIQTLNIDEIAKATIKSASNTSLIKKNSWDREKQTRSKDVDLTRVIQKPTKSNKHFEINRREILFGCNFFSQTIGVNCVSQTTTNGIIHSAKFIRSFYLCTYDCQRGRKSNELRFRAIGQ